MDLIPHVEVSLAHPDKDIVKEYRLLEVQPHSFIPICIAHHILRLQFTRIVGESTNGGCLTIYKGFILELRGHCIAKRVRLVVCLETLRMALRVGA